MDRRYASYDDYWCAYLSAHSRPETRACHYLATFYGAGLAALGVLTQQWWLLLAAILGGYAIAVGSHFVFEKNRPLIHRPLWGAISDLRMLGLAIARRLPRERQRALQE